MRILFCNYEYPPLGGGGGVINADLAEELAKKHDVSVLTSRAMDLEKRDVVNGVEVIRVPVLGRNQAAAASMMSMFSYLPSGAWNARTMVKSGRFDIVNTHFVVPTGPLGAYLASVAGIPNVLTVHGGDLYDPSKASSPHRHPLLRVAIRNLLRRADIVVGQSRNTIDNVHNFYLPDFPCELIPLGIKRPSPPVGGRAGWKLADEDKVMITVGRLVARKAVSRLIETVANFNDPTVKLIVVGDGPLLPDLKAQARELAVEDQILFAGFVSAQEKIDLLNLSDVYVSTSQHEGFGLVFLEAMAAGLPVICYDFGGQSDFLEDGVTGALIPLNELATFQEQCELFLGSTEKRKAAGAENLRRVESYFIDTCAKEYEQLFERLVSLER